MNFRKKAIVSLLSFVFFTSSFSLSYAEFENESGKDHIVGTESDTNSLLRVFASYEKTATFYLYNETEITMYNSASTSSTVAGTLSPQMLKASKRKGNWFLIDTNLGKKWIYRDSNTVQLIEPQSKNDYYTTDTDLNLHLQPFEVYVTDQILPAGTYKVTIQSGTWLYVESSEYTGWINSPTGKFTDAIESLDMSSINSIPLKTKLAKFSDNVRPGTSMKPKYITIHNTANTGKGANALTHANLLYNGNGGRYASWHYTVDNNEIYQSLPLNEIGYHAGDGSGPGNTQSIGIEICENSDGNYLKAEQNAAELTAQLLKSLNLPLSAVKKHQDFSGKYCPARILDRNDGWNDFLNKVKVAYDKLPDTQPDTSSIAYYLDINSFLGEDSVKYALSEIQSKTGWYAEYQKMDQKEPVYNIETGGFVGLNNANNAVTQLKSTTGLDASTKFSGSYTQGSKTPIYRLETGGFVGKEAAQSALEWLKSETGWWATLEPNGSIPNEYKIVTGGFVGEESVKQALNTLTEKSGWWATYVFNGNYAHSQGEPIYNLYIDNIIGESNAKSTFERLKSSTGWYAELKNTGTYVHYYKIITGAFIGLDNAKKQSEYITNTFGYYNTINEQ